MLKWVRRRLQSAKEHVERSFGRHAGAHQEAAYESERPASYNTTRAVFLQLLGGVYLIAFASHFVQFEGLYGCDGIIPVRQQLDMAGRLHWTLYPTLVRLHGMLGLDVYWMCNFLSVVGLVLSALAAAGYGCAPIMAGCWASYLSLTTVGDIFMLFQWDSLLLEAGFLAIFYAPLLQRPSKAAQSSRVAMWMLRFLLFKLMIMSGVVKITSKDRVWQQLTALYYHFASQPLPTPVSWYFRQFHPLALQLGVAFTFLVEIPCAFLILCPLRVVRHWTAAVQASLQLLIMLTGNYGFFNLLTLVLVVNLLDDSYLEQVLRSNALDDARNGKGRGDEATPLLTPGSGRRGGGVGGMAGMSPLAGWGGVQGMGAARGGFTQGPDVNQMGVERGPSMMGSLRTGMAGSGGLQPYTLDGRPLPINSPAGGNMGLGMGLGLGGAVGRGMSGGGGLHGMGAPGAAGGYHHGSSAMGGSVGGGYGARGGGGGAPLDRGLALQQLLGNSKAVQVAATIMTTVTSIDNSKFWTSVLRKGLVLFALLACFTMFRVDMDYSVASAQT